MAEELRGQSIEEQPRDTSLPPRAEPVVVAWVPGESGFTRFAILEGADAEVLDALNIPLDAQYFVRSEQYDDLYQRAWQLEANYRGARSEVRSKNDALENEIARGARRDDELADLRNRYNDLVKVTNSLDKELHTAQEAASDAQKEVESTREFWNTAHSGLDDPNREQIQWVDADPPTLAARMDTIVVGFELLWKQSKELSNRQLLTDQRISAIEPTVASLEKRMASAEKEFPAQIAQIRRMIQWDREFFGRSIAKHGKFARKLAKKVRKLQ